MPLVRFEVRNEYGLGDPELYNAKNSNYNSNYMTKKKKECDSKEILDGVAVAGLVGILRQLGDLAQLASDIFHDLHEQVMATSARGRKLSNRIQNLEADLPLFEKAIKGQRSYIHFAYVAGSEWRANLKFEQSHLLSTDLPQCMMDSYEECRDPPRLYLLDKFDSGGKGACLKRYSDPSYFKRVWAASELEKAEKVQIEKKARKIKRKGSHITNGESHHGSSVSQRFSSTHFAFSSTEQQHFSADNTPIYTTRQKSELESRSSSFDSRRLNFVEPILDTNSLGVPDEPENSSPCISKPPVNQEFIFASDMHDKVNDISPYTSSPSVTWDEKTEILKPISPISCDDILVDDTQSLKSTQISSNESDVEPDISALGTIEPEINISNSPDVLNHFDDITSETDNYMDALNTLDSETETDIECQTKHELKSTEDTSGNMDTLVATENLRMMPPLTIEPLQDPDCSVNNQISNDSYEGFYEQPFESNICNSPTSSEVSNADIASGSHISLTEIESTENTCNLMLPTESLESVTPPHLIDSIQHPNYSISNQISNGNATEFEAADGQPLESSICNSPAMLESTTCELRSKKSARNQISNGNNIEFEVANDQPPESSICNSPTMLEFNTNESKSINSPTMLESNTNELSINSPPVYISNIPSPKLWTNGGLLGLAPSKPPVFSVTNISNEDYVSDASIKDPPNEIVSRDSSYTEKMIGGKIDNMVQQIDNGYSKNTESLSNESGQSTMDIKSSLSSLAQRILSNSLQRKPSVTLTQSEDASLGFNKPQVSKVVSKACDTDEITSSKTPIHLDSQLSGNSSPPLKHMKISFHPMYGSETSNLKLEYATEDLTFPSFQLLPKSDDHLEDNGSQTDDDDDDTFCRSCPYTSEDLNDSNSELWEQDDRENNDSNYNALDRLSLSSSSVSSFKGFFQGHKEPTLEIENLEAANSILNFQNGNSVNLPGLDSFIFNSGSQNDLPPPPPLPPMQWRTMKGSFDKEELEKDSTVAEIVEHFNDLHVQRFAHAHEQQEKNIPTPHPFLQIMPNAQNEIKDNDIDSKQLDLREELFHQINNQHNIQELSGHRNPNITANGQEVDEREELLHQIRNKSFNLRRTSATKSSSVPQSTANINVAAILEKASAIRQAFVGSEDGGDDDNWSDS